MKLWLATVVTMSVAVLISCADGSGQSAGVREPCPTKPAAATVSDPPETLDGLVNRMAEALTCPGQVAHIVVRTQSEGRWETWSGEGEYWVDMAQGVGRIAPVDNPDLVEPDGKIVRGDGQYYADSDGEPERVPPPDCLGEELAPLAAIIDTDCLFFRFGNFHIEIDDEARTDGRRVIAVEATGYFPGGPDEDDLLDLTYTLYVNPEAYLPMGTLLESSYVHDSSLGERTETTFEIEFLPSSSLATGFFQPSSVGYFEPDLGTELDALEGEVYWLGEEFSGANGFPALAFDHVWSPEQLAGDNTYVGILSYTEASDPYSAPVSLHEHRRDARLEAYLADPNLKPGDCLAERREVALPGGHGFIFGVSLSDDSGQCPAASHYEATAFMGDTIITIIVSANTNHRFDSAEAMEHLLRGLRSRE